MHYVISEISLDIVDSSVFGATRKEHYRNLRAKIVPDHVITNLTHLSRTGFRKCPVEIVGPA